MQNNTAIILLLLSVGLFYTFTNGQYQEVKVKQTEAREYRDVLRDFSAIVESRDNLVLTYETFPRAEIDRMNKVLPDNIDNVQLAFDLDGMASRYGISISNIQAATGPTTGSALVVLPENTLVYDKATVTFGFVSTYENFMRLLSDLEKNLRIMDVRSIFFQSSESGFYNFQVSVETYWLK